jgi:hypothetical protein
LLDANARQFDGGLRLLETLARHAIIQAQQNIAFRDDLIEVGQNRRYLARQLGADYEQFARLHQARGADHLLERAELDRRDRVGDRLGLRLPAAAEPVSPARQSQTHQNQDDQELFHGKSPCC